MIDFKDKIVKKRIITGTVLATVLALGIAMTCYDPLGPIMADDNPVSPLFWRLSWLLDPPSQTTTRVTHPPHPSVRPPQTGRDQVHGRLPDGGRARAGVG